MATAVSIERSGDSKAWRLLGIGALLAAVAHVVPVSRSLFSPLVTLLHEFGHAVTAWILGCPAIPSFDFVYGGGVTHHKYFQTPLGILIGAGWIWLAWTFRRNARTLTMIGLIGGVWLVAVSSEWRREVVISSMGHGGELVLAGVLLYMALSGVGWRVPEVERPLGAFAAFFVQIQTMRFAWRLRNDAAFLSEYLGGKGGAMMHDLELIALDVKIWTGVSFDVPQVAGLLLVSSLVVPLAAVLLFVKRDSVGAWTKRLRSLGP